MAREFFIDGYNVMHQFPEWRKLMEIDLTNARNQLLMKLRHFAKTHRVQITVVFDGQENPASNFHESGIHVIFSKAPQKADDILKKYIAQKQKGKECVVVSSDQDIVHYAKICGVQVESSQHFVTRLRQRGKNEIDPTYSALLPLTEKELAEWIKLFEKGKPLSEK